MTHPHKYWFAIVTLLALSVPVDAQKLEPITPDRPASTTPEGVEVLARGPVHEAYAATVETPAGGSPLVTRVPPEPIEELPPDRKPDGENVQWIPGYWHWDEERSDFIWISGFWRVPPPGRVWVPGSWREARGGHQWVHGFWQETREAEKPQIEYLPPPPQPIEVAPSTPAPGESFVYVPGCWVYRQRYVWRPGYWIDQRPGWIWTPAHYRWTPAGYVFVDGYWDYPLAGRGCLFAPVAFTQPVYTRPRFVFSPTFVVSEPALYTSLFVRRGWGCYYFGDYFEARYSNIGFNPWCGRVRSSGFAISIGFGSGFFDDPLWCYYRTHYRHDRGWALGISNVYAGRYNGTWARPPRTLVQQANVINNVTVNNTTITNTIINNINVTDNRTSLALLAPVNNVPSTNERFALKPVTQAERIREQQFAAELRAVGKERKQLETTITDRGTTPVTQRDPIRAVRLDVPATVTARAQIPETKRVTLPPPAPAIANQPAPRPAVPPVIAKPSAPVANPEPSPKAPTNPQPSPQSPPKNPTPAPTPRPPINPSPTPKPPTTNPTPAPQPIPKPPVNPTPAPTNPAPKPPATNPTPAPTPRPPINPSPTPKPPTTNPTPAPQPVPKPPVNPTPVPTNPAPKPPTTNPTPAPTPRPPINPSPTPKLPTTNPTPAPQPIPKPPINPMPAPKAAPSVTPAPAPRPPVAPQSPKKPQEEKPRESNKS